MGTDPPRHPRVSPTVKRWVNWVLTGVWLVGGAVVLEFLHISLWAEIALVAVLLGVVLVVELVFFRWNEGRWPAVETAGNRDESNAGPRRNCGLTLASASALAAGFCAPGAGRRIAPAMQAHITTSIVAPGNARESAICAAVGVTAGVSTPVTPEWRSWVLVSEERLAHLPHPPSRSPLAGPFWRPEPGTPMRLGPTRASAW